MLNTRFHFKELEWNEENIKNVIHEACESCNIKVGKIMPDLRMTLCGTIPGPELPMIMYILGFDETMKRIDHVEKLIIQYYTINDGENN